LTEHLSAAHALLRSPLLELSLAIVNDATMSRLHNQFMSIATPTDVLTFELDEASDGSITSGEVVVCLDEACRQAQRLGSSVERELLLYALHGMLHLVGFDDKTDAEFRTMHRKEDQLLTQIGVGPVFAGKSTRRPTRSKGK
jgi:probable rRNA maturation factor